MDTTPTVYGNNISELIENAALEMLAFYGGRPLDTISLEQEGSGIEFAFTSYPQKICDIRIRSRWLGGKEDVSYGITEALHPITYMEFVMEGAELQVRGRNFDARSSIDEISRTLGLHEDHTPTAEDVVAAFNSAYSHSPVSAAFQGNMDLLLLRTPAYDPGIGALVNTFDTVLGMGADSIDPDGGTEFISEEGHDYIHQMTDILEILQGQGLHGDYSIVSTSLRREKSSPYSAFAKYM